MAFETGDQETMRQKTSRKKHSLQLIQIVTTPRELWNYFMNTGLRN